MTGLYQGLNQTTVTPEYENLYSFKIALSGLVDICSNDPLPMNTAFSRQQYVDLLLVRRYDSLLSSPPCQDLISASTVYQQLRPPQRFPKMSTFYEVCIG